MELLLDSLMLTMLTRQQIAADSSVQLTKNVSFCSILFCTVGRDCTEQMSGLVQDFWSFRGLQLHSVSSHIHTPTDTLPHLYTHLQSHTHMYTHTHGEREKVHRETHRDTKRHANLDRHTH